jgi:single-stranded-DNA-specific exonuclease
MRLARNIIRRTLPQQLPADLSVLHPVLSRIYAARHITSSNQLEYSLQQLLSYEDLAGIDQSVALLADGLKNSARILIVADFDADGATSCAVAMQGLSMLGANNLHYLVPNRFEYGYGLSPEIVEVAAELAPDILITVDNGISSNEGVRVARKHGIKVLVTDHHLPGAELPEADAIVNPNLHGDRFASKNLAGVGVIFYVLLALRTALREAGYFQKAGLQEPNLAVLLDLVALGTVADVVPLDHNNRILVEQGLRRIRAGKCCAGIRALLDVAGRDPRSITAADLGFAVGPRLNAAGRMQDMSLGIECLLASTPADAKAYAARLDELNQQRRSVEADMQQQALSILKTLSMEEGVDLPAGLCLFDEGWHQGVIGILASRIKDRVHRPVIVFAPGDAHELKGSARSVPGIHIRDALDALAARHPGLLTRFGGHAMAAGLSLPRSHYDAFVDAFNEIICEQGQESLKGVIYSDGELDEGTLTLSFAEHLRQGGPWGQAFPEPVFDGRFEVVSQRVVGDKHLKLQLRQPDSRQGIDAIAFNMDVHECNDELSRVEIAYRLAVNDFNGSRSVQLVIEQLRSLD